MADIKVLSLSLYPDKEHVTFDYRIKNTIVKFVGDILINDTNVIIYVCDNLDGREDKRHNVFEYWYQQAASHYNYVEKYNHSVFSENGYMINASLIYNKNNFLADYIIDNFKKEIGLL